MNARPDLPAFMRSPDDLREARADHLRREMAAITSRLAARDRAPRDTSVRIGPDLLAGLAVAIAIGGAAAGVLGAAATDFLVGRCLWPGMVGCEPGKPIFMPGDQPEPSWMQAPEDGA